MDQLEQLIKDEFNRAAGEEEAVIQKDDSLSMPEGKKEALYAGIMEKIEGMKQEEMYAGMSEEDKKALEIGRKIMEEEAHGETKAKSVRKKKRIRVYIGLAAVLVFVLAVGVTSMGGAERVIQMVTQMVGDREVEKVNSSEDNKVLVNEDEEEAYQRVSEEFGVEPVRILMKPEDMNFQYIDIDEKLQLAELCYSFRGENIMYFINASYSDTSWGIDVEDGKVDQYVMKRNNCKIEVKEYETAEKSTKRYSASFKYYGLEYYLIGTMNKEEFELIVNNLHFIQ